MAYRLKELAALVGGQLEGDNIEINGVGGAENAAADEISFAQNEDYLSLAQEHAGAVLVSEELAQAKLDVPVIIVDNPRLAFAKIADKFTPSPYQNFKIADDAVISPTAEIGAEVSIHAGVVIAEEAELGDGVVLAPGVYVGKEATIEEGTIVHPNVTIERRSQIGAQVEINAGTVIGAEGFGFEEDEEGYAKVPQFGNVIIGDEVEIGANVTIDRGATGATTIGRSTKIDNLVHIAHNVEIGPECLIVGQVGISGSVEIGEKVTLAGQSGVVGHLKIGSNTTVAARGVVTHDIEAESFVSGYPAHNHRKERRIKAVRNKLPEMKKRLRKLEQKIAKLEEK